jgi:hypothetical protein
LENSILTEDYKAENEKNPSNVLFFETVFHGGMA